MRYGSVLAVAVLANQLQLYTKNHKYQAMSLPKVILMCVYHGHSLCCHLNSCISNNTLNTAAVCMRHSCSHAELTHEPLHQGLLNQL